MGKKLLSVCCFFGNIKNNRKEIIIKQFWGSACKPFLATWPWSCEGFPPLRRRSRLTTHRFSSRSRTDSASPRRASAAGFPAPTSCCIRLLDNSVSFCGFRRRTGNRSTRFGFLPSFCLSVLLFGGLSGELAAHSRPSCRPRFQSRRPLLLAWKK